MNNADELLDLVRAAEIAGDATALHDARERYVALDPAGDLAAEQRYRLGLSRLFQRQDRAGALELFKQAANERGAAIAPHARVSLALLLQGTGKRQQAMFELRKMLPQGCLPTVHTAQALDFLSLMMRDSGQPSGEIMAVDKQRIEHLTTMMVGATDVGERAHFMLRVGAAYADGGTGTDFAMARKMFDDVVKLGAAAGATTVAMAKAALKQLPR